MSVRLLQDLTPLEKLALIDMSYSRIDTYDMCRAKYYYSYIQKEERVFGPAAALGNMVHGVLEEVDWTAPLDLDAMLENLVKQRDVYDPDREIPADLVAVGTTVLEEFVDRHDGDRFNVLGAEVPFAIVVGSALIVGYIDRVDRDANGIHITDYKTGKYEVAQKNVADNFQTGLYALAMSKTYPGEPITAELYYLRSGKQKGHLYTPEELEVVEQRLVDKINEIITDRNYSPTDNTRVCSFCDFRKNGACAVGVRRYGGTH